MQRPLWLKIAKLAENFNSENLNVTLEKFIDQPLAQPGKIVVGIADSTFRCDGLSATSDGQKEAWRERGVCDYWRSGNKGWTSCIAGELPMIPGMGGTPEPDGEVPRIDIG